MSVVDFDLRTSRDLDGFARVGDETARLLAGPTSRNAESLASHLDRLGPLDRESRSPQEVRDLVHEAGLVGRGGGEFPLASKLEMAVRSPGVPLVVVNASEGEPASRKDATLLSSRPHLVLDGAQVVAAAVGAEHVVVYLHRGDSSTRALRHAVTERHGQPGPTFHLVSAPDQYVAGETSAIVSFLELGVALPRRRSIAAAAHGVAGRPTIVSNTETYAHVALIARHGAQWFRQCGSPTIPGSTLVTMAGAVSDPGLVLEVLGGATIGDVLRESGGTLEGTRAVLVGGYAGTWVDGQAAWHATLDRQWLRHVGAPLGCGLIAVLGHQQCGLAESARLLAWMADQSSGQCGPCFSGLPAIARLARDLATGNATRRDVTRLRQLAVSVRGRGACGHPTGTAQLLESTLDVFAEETRRHVKGHSCVARGTGLALVKSGVVG
jgi:NADH:ubiquinone oxidoreductase subunit F (NADH-binding)